MTDAKTKEDAGMEKKVADYLGTMAPGGRLTKSFLAVMAKEPNFAGALFCERCRNRTAINQEGLAMFLQWGKEKFGDEFVFNPLTHYFSTSLCPDCEQGQGEDAHGDIVEAA